LKKQRYVGYVRVSTESQKFNTSSDDQEKIITEYCEKNGIELVHIFKDNARSGKDTYDRNHYKQMISFISNSINKIDGIITTKTDRLHRKVANLLYFCENVIKANKLNYISIEDHINLSTSEGENWIVFLGWMAEKERELIFERTKAGRKTTALQRKYAGGKVPYGYKVVDKVVKIDKNEEKVVKEIFSWYIEGKTAYWIKNELNKLKESNSIYKTRNERVLESLTEEEIGKRTHTKVCKWHESGIFSILRNEAYLGIYKYNGKIENNGIIVKNDVVPRLITKKMWNQARERDKELRKGDFTKKPIKVVAYLREDDQEKEKEIKKACEEKGYELVQIFKEPVTSSTSIFRSSFLEMIKYVKTKQNKIKGILCYSIYELHHEYESFLDMLEYDFGGMKTKPIIYSVEEKIDSSTDEKLDEIGLLISKEKRKRRSYK